MILESKETEIQTSGNFQALDFGIRQGDMDLVIEILRSKMYKNPIGAICREISSNSRDANREASNFSPIEIGIQDSPFITSELCIYFKDGGLGISPDRMGDVFVNYGASTKRDSNKFTGGFGLGAKTPFSYSDNFWIETVYENVRYSYCAAIEEGKRGKIYLLSSKETDEESGTTIIVPIKNNDRSTFEEEVYKATIFWPQTPIYKNFRIKPELIKLHKFFENEEFLICDNNNFISGYFGLLLDGIYYSIDSSVIKFANKYIDSKLFIFKFKVGELTISANREALQYDEKTQKKIQSKFEDLIQLAQREYEKEVKLKISWIDSYIYYLTQFRNNPYLRLLNNFGYDEWIRKISIFNGIRFDSSYGLFPNLQLFHRQKDVKTNNCGFFPVSIKQYPIYFFDKNKKFLPSKDLTIFEKNTSYFALVPANSKLLDWDKLTLSQKKPLVKHMRRLQGDLELFKSLGLDYSNYSQIEKTRVQREKVERQKKTSIEIKIFEQPMDKNWIKRTTSYGGRLRYTRPGCFDALEINENKEINVKDSQEHVLILVDNIHELPTETDEIKMLRYGVQLGLIPNFSIYFANKTKGIKCLKYFKTLEEKVKEKLDQNIISGIINLAGWQEFDKIDFWSKITFASNDLKQIKDEIVKYQTQKGKVDVYLSVDLKEKYSHLNTLNPIVEKFNEFKKACKMLELVDNWEFSYKFDILKDYVLLIEKDLITKGLLK